MSHVMQRYMNVAEDSVDGEVQWVTQFPDTTGTAYPGSGTQSDYRVHKVIEPGTPMVGDIPTDYWERWDASTSDGMTFTTDEGTGDIEVWVGQVGNDALSLYGTGTVPHWSAGTQYVEFFEGQNLAGASIVAMDYTSNTQFAVLECVDVAGSSSGNRWGFSGMSDSRFGYQSNGNPGVFDALSIRPFTNDMDSIPCVYGFRNVHNATDDNDLTTWCGITENSLRLAQADSALNGSDYIDLGSYNRGNTWATNARINEVIIYDRALTDAEAAQVANYLSRKWQVQNEDSASTVIASPVPHKPDDRFPTSLPNLQGWYRSDHTGGMTFATGDKDAGGTVSSWTDMTGNVTCNTAGSGDSDVTFHPSGAVRGGFPSVEGGSAAGTPRSIHPSTSIATNNDTGQQQLHWSVGTFGQSALISTWGGTMNNVLGCVTYNNYSGDDVDGPVCSYLASTVPATSYLIMSSGPLAHVGDRIHINVWRIEDTGTDATVETWYAGLKAPDRFSTTADADPLMCIGAFATSNFDAEGAQMLELGVCGSLTSTVQTYSDADVENLIRYLCNRYGVDYMPDETPKTVGAWSRQLQYGAQDDLVYWFRAEDSYFTKTGDTITSWDDHDYVTQHARDMNDTDAGSTPPDAVINMADREAAQFVSASSEYLKDDTGYTWSESSVFPADNDEHSSFAIFRNTGAKGASKHTWQGCGILRQSSTTGKITYRASSNNLVGTNDVHDTWAIAIGTYEGIAGDQNLYINDDSVNTTDGSPAGSSSTKPAVGAATSGSGPNDCDTLEVGEYKHVLTADERAALLAYARYRYNDGFTS